MIDNFKDFLNEGFWNFLTKNPKRLYSTVKDALEDYEHDLLTRPKLGKMKYSEIDGTIKFLGKKISPKVVKRLNIDTFLKGLYTISGAHKNSEDLKDKIEHHFEVYLSSLKERINKYYSEEKIDLKDEEYDEEFRELKKLKQEVDVRIPRKKFEKKKHKLQIELLKLQEWYKDNNERIVIVFEGRDAAGKGSCITALTEFLDPKYFKVATFGIPTDYDRKNWFERYIKELPQPGNMTLYDRSWYNRAINDPVMGYCSQEQHEQFMEEVGPFEDKLISEGIHFIKFWFSVDKDTQQLRFKMRQANPLKYWKFSPNDLATMDKWDKFTAYKEKMFALTSKPNRPWVVVDSNDKRQAKLNAMRYVLKTIPYPDKDMDKINEMKPEIIIPMI
jgi:polyphosphate kinase 2